MRSNPYDRALTIARRTLHRAGYEGFSIRWEFYKVKCGVSSVFPKGFYWDECLAIRVPRGTDPYEVRKITNGALERDFVWAMYRTRVREKHPRKWRDRLPLHTRRADKRWNDRLDYR